MAAFAKTILILGVVLLNIPHLLCPLTCAADASVVAPLPKCPHCDPTNRPEPKTKTPLPADDCRSGCCDQDPAILVPSEVQAEPQTLKASFEPLAVLSSTYVSATLPSGMRVDYWPPPPSSQPGSRLSILLERFLF